MARCLYQEWTLADLTCLFFGRCQHHDIYWGCFEVTHHPAHSYSVPSTIRHPCAGADGAGADPQQRRHGGRGAGSADQLHVRHPGGLHPAARLHRGLQRHQLRLRVRRQLRGAGGGEHGGRARLAGRLARGQHRGRLLHPERGPGAQGGARAPGGGGYTAHNQIQMIIQQLYYRIDIFVLF